MNIIGVCGKGGSGKDTIANYLVDYHHYNRVAAADAMKVDLCNYLDMDLETLEKIKNKELTLVDEYDTDVEFRDYGSFSIRRFLQLYGMDMRYRIADTYWLERSIKEKVNELGTNGQTNIVVSDVRFEIEYDWIKNNGGSVIYVDGRTGLTKHQSKHVSEDFVNTTAKDKCDYVINNIGSLETLFRQVEDYLNGKNKS
mgnify:FL=1|jgi:cytidylate kinase